MTDTTNPTASNDAADLIAEKTGVDKTLVERAQQAVGAAVDATVGAVKDHPVAAAGIAAGVAAAAAGVAYGASKLGGDDKTRSSSSKGGGTKATAKR